MKSNIHELPGVLELGRKLGAVHFIISNVYPYSADMDKETLVCSFAQKYCLFQIAMDTGIAIPQDGF